MATSNSIPSNNPISSIQHPFFPSGIGDGNLFDVREGIPIEDALNQASCFLDNALEMAEEIMDRHGQYYTLASTIEFGLAPSESGEDSPDWHCYRLSQLLAKAMSDMGQLYRLVDCLKIANDAVANQRAEVKA